MIPQTIIICNNTNDDIELFNKEKPYVILSSKVKELITSKIFNPPFFRVIIIESHVKLYDEQIQQLYNSLLLNGTFIINKKHNHLFNNLNNPHKKYEDYVLIHKKNNIIFINNYNRTPVDCIIVGVQKSATTSLLTNLRRHDDVSAFDDEIHYVDINWMKGINYYKSKHDYTKKIILEKNPDLLYLDNTHWMIQNMNPYVKLIISLRNPINRAYSSWQMIKNNGWINISFEQAIEEELKYRMNENKTFFTAVFHYLQRGLYFKQIQNLLKWFPKQNIKITIMENMIGNEEDFYNEIYDFLDLKRVKLEYTKERINKYDSEISVEMYNKLKDFFTEDVRQLETYLGYKTNWF